MKMLMVVVVIYCVQLEKVIESLVTTVAQKEQELAEFQAKYKIRVREDGEQQNQESESTGKDGAGVLV